MKQGFYHFTKASGNVALDCEIKSDLVDKQKAISSQIALLLIIHDIYDHYIADDDSKL